MATTGPKAEVIAKRGDVILQLGKAEPENTIRNILVSSMVLSLGSPVFTTMFDGRFAEGQSLSPASPCVVPLPDDDPDSIILICKIIHVQNSTLQITITATAFANLAIVCNKYDCVDAVRPWSIVWVAALLQSPNAPEFEKMLLATYLRDLPQEFFKVSQSLIRDRSNVFSITTAMNGHEFLPVKLYEQVLQAQIQYREEVVAAFGRSIVTGKETCDPSKARIGGFLRALHLARLWPIRLYSIPHIKTELRKLSENENATTSTKTATICASYTWYSCRNSNSMKTNLILELDKLYDVVKGLCLDCIAQQVLGKAPINCRVGHGKTGRLIYP